LEEIGELEGLGDGPCLGDECPFCRDAGADRRILRVSDGNGGDERGGDDESGGGDNAFHGFVSGLKEGQSISTVLARSVCACEAAVATQPAAALFPRLRRCQASPATISASPRLQLRQSTTKASARQETSPAQAVAGG